MSALTEKVAREHPPLTVGRPPDIGIGCRHCSHAASYAEHVAEVTEEAIRANVAAEIREQADTFMRVTLATYDDLAVKAYLDAYRIAEGKQP